MSGSTDFKATRKREGSHTRDGVAAGVLTVAIGLSVRFPITSVSPLLEDIALSYHLTPAGISALSAIPVLLFGFASPLAPWLVSRFGLSRAITALLAALAIATLLRPLTSATLFAGTVVVGGAIALLGILAPQIIRQNLSKRAGFWTGVYTTSFGVSAALGAALTLPLFTALGEHTARTLSAWAVPLLVAFGLSLALGKKSGSPSASGEGVRGGEVPASPPAASIFRTRGIWSVTGFFACQALIYFTLTAWLPTIAMSRGVDPVAAGVMLAWMSIAGLPASLLAPSLASREKWRGPLLFVMAILAISGLLTLAFAPVSLMPLAIAVTGVALSSAFGLSIAFIVFTTPSVTQTAAFSAITQGGGYAIAAAGPLLAGLFVGAGASWQHVLVALALVVIAELGFGLASARAASARASADRAAHSHSHT